VPTLPLRRKVAGESTAVNLLLLFVLAGLGTALLLPQYRNYTLQGHARLAAEALRDLQARQQTWQQRNPGQRLRSFEALGYAGPAVYVSSDGTSSSSANVNSIYRISLSTSAAGTPEACGLAVDNPNGFVLVAEPVQTQRIDTRCRRMCLSSSGEMGTTGDAGTDACWERQRP
jgi:Tfp pilus assembly protein PilE